MNPNWAEENLQTIRTLMERSALYRRALAPIMLLAGVIGTAAAALGILLRINTFGGFLTLWFSAAALAVVGALLIARRQALKEQEAFWSPPTRRVTQALLPPLTAGLCLGALPAFSDAPFDVAPLVTLAWILFYGFALHAAGFFMSRGIKLFGWSFIVLACLLIYGVAAEKIDLDNKGYFTRGELQKFMKEISR